MSFIQKPSSGWTHSDSELTSGHGVAFAGSYIGSIRMDRSMRSIQFDQRTEVTREAIKLVAEAAGVFPQQRRKVSPLVQQCLTSDPIVKRWPIHLYVSTSGLSVCISETGEVVANHIMPVISFATGAEASNYSIFGYVAKDERDVRECHVFDCGRRAPECMTTIGQAFELRYKAFLQKGQQQAMMRESAPSAIYGDSSSVVIGAKSNPVKPPVDQVGQYHDIAPPDDSYGDLGYPQAMQDPLDMYGDNDGPVRQLHNIPDYDNPQGDSSMGGGQLSINPDYDMPSGEQYSTEPQYDTASGTMAPVEPQYDTASGTMAPVEPQYDTASNSMGQEPQYDTASAISQSVRIRKEPQYDFAEEAPRQLNIIPEYDEGNMGGDAGDDYDEAAPDYDPRAPVQQAPKSRGHDRDIHVEDWFHGQLSRTAADKLVSSDGDFIVRESMHTRGQYILSAVQGGQVKHLLLVDPSGKVRTRDMAFDSVPHLINYHLSTNLPIISRGSRVVLGKPVVRVSDSYSSFAARF